MLMTSLCHITFQSCDHVLTAEIQNSRKSARSGRPGRRRRRRSARLLRSVSVPPPLLLRHSSSRLRAVLPLTPRRLLSRLHTLAVFDLSCLLSGTNPLTGKYLASTVPLALVAWSTLRAMGRWRTQPTTLTPPMGRPARCTSNVSSCRLYHLALSSHPRD